MFVVEKDGFINQHSSLSLHMLILLDDGNNTKVVDEVMSEERKRCSKCHRELPMTEEYFANRKESKDGFRGVCRECRGKQFLSRDYINEKTTKPCKQCKKIKEVNEENFSKSVRNNDGFLNVCNECQINNRGNVSKEGCKKCIKCNRELPLNSDYFTKSEGCLDGYRNVCFECKGGEFHPRERNIWTENEIETLLKYYPYFSNEELQFKYLNSHTIYSISDYATKILNVYKDEKYLKERYWTEEEDQFLIENYSNTENEELAELFEKKEPAIRARAIKYGLKKTLGGQKRNYPR